MYPVGEYEEVKIIQDNSAIHRARVTREWYKRHPRLSLLSHPPYSPDLNPIENMWALKVKNWQYGKDRHLEALVAHAFRSWVELGNTPEVTENCVLSMPRRLQAVIDNEGRWTKH